MDGRGHKAMLGGVLCNDYFTVNGWVLSHARFLPVLMCVRQYSFCGRKHVKNITIFNSIIMYRVLFTNQENRAALVIMVVRADSRPVQPARAVDTQRVDWRPHASLARRCL
jgi:hypothetical protein